MYLKYFTDNVDDGLSIEERLKQIYLHNYRYLNYNFKNLDINFKKFLREFTIYEQHENLINPKLEDKYINLSDESLNIYFLYFMLQHCKNKINNISISIFCQMNKEDILNNYESKKSHFIVQYLKKFKNLFESNNFNKEVILKNDESSILLLDNNDIYFKFSNYIVSYVKLTNIQLTNKKVQLNEGVKINEKVQLYKQPNKEELQINFNLYEIFKKIYEFIKNYNILKYFKITPNVKIKNLHNNLLDYGFIKTKIFSHDVEDFHLYDTNFSLYFFELQKIIKDKGKIQEITDITGIDGYIKIIKSYLKYYYEKKNSIENYLDFNFVEKPDYDIPDEVNKQINVYANIKIRESTKN